VIQYIVILYASWGVLLAGLLAALYRNHFQQTYFHATYFVPWADSVAQLKQSEIEVIEKPGAVLVERSGGQSNVGEFKKYLDKKKEQWTRWGGQARDSKLKNEKVFKLCECTAQIAVPLGLILMLFFSVVNMP